MIVARMTVRRAEFTTAAALAFAVCLFPGVVRAQPAKGFDFCVPPVGPKCVHDGETGAGAACNREVEAFIATVFAYRQCLERESERAIRESNEIIDHWRCRQRGERCGR
jgi:hypothetical protein